VIVRATDASKIEAVSFAAAVSVALSITSPAIGIAGGCSESTNIILSRTNAFIENSAIGSDTNKVGYLDLDASSTAEIHALIGAVAAGVAFGNTGVGVAVGVAVARNFIGWDPNGAEATPTYSTRTRPERASPP